MEIAGIFLIFTALCYGVELIFPYMAGYCETLEVFYLLFAAVTLVLQILRRDPPPPPVTAPPAK